MSQQGLSLESYSELITSNSRIQHLHNQLDLESSGVSVNSLKNSIDTQINEKANQIVITARGENPERLQLIVNSLGKNSIEDFKARLINEKNKEILKVEKMLKSIEKDLEGVPKLLNVEGSNASAQQVIQMPLINPLYESLAIRWDELNYSIGQLTAEKEYLEESLEIGSRGLYIVQQQSPLPQEPVAPRKMPNIAVAGVLGFMVGVWLTCTRTYWWRRRRWWRRWR